MALRNIVKLGDSTLRKKSREVTVFDEKLHTLLGDMAQTLLKEDGVGLAAVQVGVLRRVVVINRGGEILELVNPKIIKSSGVQEEVEGCLSIPGQYGITHRPENATVRAQDRNGKTIEVSDSGLIARAFCHEIDHLDGILFIDHALRMLKPSELK